MGRAIGRAVSLRNNTYEVVFSSPSIDDGELKITSIVTQVDGSEAYSPLKYRIASVGCLTDGFALMRLCLAEDVNVTITDITQNRLVFCGYVVPNSLNQVVMGINDSITIECVDNLGYAKYLPYSKVGAGFASMTIGDFCERIRELLGLRNVYISNSLIIRNPVSGEETAAYEQLKFAENYIYDGALEPGYDGDGHPTYADKSASCDVALEMISSSLLMTWVQIGDNLYLTSGIADESYRDLSGNTHSIDAVLDIVEDDMGEGGIQVSTIALSTSYSLSHPTRQEKVAAIPDVFAPESFVSNNDYFSVAVGEDNVEIHTLTSQIYNIASYASFVGKAVTDIGQWHPSAAIGGYNISLRVPTGVTSRETLLQQRAEFATAFASRRCSLAIDFKVVYGGNRIPVDEKEAEDAQLSISISCGDKSYNGNGEWVDGPASFLYGADSSRKRERPKISLANRPDGPLVVAINSIRELNIDSSPTVVFLTEFKVDIVPNSASRCADNMIGDSDEKWGDLANTRGQSYNLELPISTRYALSDKVWDTYIGGVEYRGYEYEQYEASDGTNELLIKRSGVDFLYGASRSSMRRRVEELANPGDRLRYEFNVFRDYIDAIGDCTSPLWSHKDIVAATCDMLNSITLITVI